tara:strand:+ start:1466 stop:1810 length:345 start_codon:yes stop_codon:yes gene_type:complete
MTISKINFLNAIVLAVMGLWGYVEVSSPTALIPVFFGVIIGLLTLISLKFPKLKKPTLVIACLFTFLILFALTGMRLPKSLESGGFGLMRVLVMISTSTLSVIIFGRYILKPNT